MPKWVMLASIQIFHSTGKGGNIYGRYTDQKYGLSTLYHGGGKCPEATKNWV
jgi:hypothetical protein